MQKSGIILLNKPVKISSNSAVNKVKYLINAKKAGHLGTLDPLASGVLPITFGKATRLFDYFLTKQKIYKAVFVFGFETDTLDCEGNITKMVNYEVSEKNISQILNNFVGEIEQMPPQFSALKINGRKAYEIARKGENVELNTRKIKINSIKFKKIEDFDQINALFNFFIEANKDENSSKNFDVIKENFYKNAFEFEISCGSGTYIRSLARDIAEALKTCGMMASLERTMCGDFNIENCYSFKQIQNGKFQILRVEDVINLEKIEISDQESEKLLCGQNVTFQKFDGLKKLYSSSEFLGLASCKNGNLKIEVYLKED